MSDDGAPKSAHVDSSSKLRHLLAIAAKPGNQHWFVRVAAAQQWLVTAAAHHGLDLADYQHTADTSALRHILKHHGDPERERRRGNVPVTPDELMMLADIVSAPDFVVFGLSSRRGEDIVALAKENGNGTVTYLEEVRRGRKQLALQTMWKVPGAIDASRLRATLNLDARSVPQDEVVIIDRRRADKTKR